MVGADKLMGSPHSPRGKWIEKRLLHLSPCGLISPHAKDIHDYEIDGFYFKQVRSEKYNIKQVRPNFDSSDPTPAGGCHSYGQGSHPCTAGVKNVVFIIDVLASMSDEAAPWKFGLSFEQFDWLLNQIPEEEFLQCYQLQWEGFHPRIHFPSCILYRNSVRKWR